MVQGDVNLTCDAWQASNTDAYFAVTAHWIKESTDSQWELKSALIGFTKLNNAHNGVRLGQALFKVIKRVGIENKVSEHSLAIALAAHTLNAITPSSPSPSCLPHHHHHHHCACLVAIAIMSASSPSSSCLHRHRACVVTTTLSCGPCPGCHHEGRPCHLRQCKQQHNNDEGIGRTSEDYYAQEVRLEEEEDQVGLFIDVLPFRSLLINYSCLAHVINIATQKLIKTYSDSPHFNPKKPDDHVPTSRDEVGLVRTIVVKVPYNVLSSTRTIPLTQTWAT